MKTFYTISQAAGMIRSNKFLDKADAIAIASHRAEARNVPVKIYEHEEGGEKKSILVANPDGSVEKPKGLGHEISEAGHHQMARNADQAHLLFASTQDQTKVESAEEDMLYTSFYLQDPISEQTVANLEKEIGCVMGLQEDRVIHCYSVDSAIVKKVEEGLAANKIGLAKLKRHRLEASTERVESATKKSIQRARSAYLPEMNVRASISYGSNCRIRCHCELHPGTGDAAPVISVYGDGMKLGDVKSDREAAALMSQYAAGCFGKFLKKELA